MSEVDPASIRSIAFASTCSLALLDLETGKPVAAGIETGIDREDEQNIILWKDQRADTETDTINASKHEYLRYFGGQLSILMQLPKILWLKRHMTNAMFTRCKFYDLHDAMAFLATRNSTSPCTEACEREVLPIGVDGTAKGWSREFLSLFGLDDLAAEGFKRTGGVCKVGPGPFYRLVM